MTIGKSLLQELILESEVTRRYLASVPFEKKNFKPTEKSEELGRLAIHVAEITAWWASCLQDDRLDFIGFEPKDIQSTDELLNYFDELLAEAKNALLKVNDAEFEKNWSMIYGDDVIFTLPKKQVARIFCMNHIVHHRAQLSVYLRLLDIPVPAVYDPSADDEQVTTIRDFRKFI